MFSGVVSTCFMFGMLSVSCCVNPVVSSSFVTVSDSGCVRYTVLFCVVMCLALVGDCSVVSCVLAVLSKSWL